MSRPLAALMLAALLVLAGVAARAYSATAAGPPEVGVPTGGQNAFEFVSQIDQDGLNFTAYGYLTHIQGLDDALLYTDPISRTEQTARFTLYSTSTLTTRNIISNVIALDTSGPLTVYFNPGGGASFTAPASFASGTPIVTASTRSQNINDVQTTTPLPRGISTGVSELTQLTATPFSLGGQQYSLGRSGLLERLFFTGTAIRLGPDSPRAVSVVAGNAVVTGGTTPSTPTPTIPELGPSLLFGTGLIVTLGYALGRMGRRNASLGPRDRRSPTRQP